MRYRRNMRLTFCLTIICLVHILLNANATKSKYTVIAPGTIHCNEKYTAALAVYYTTQPCRIKVGLISTFYKVSAEVEVAQNEVKNVQFVLPCLKKADFNLTAEGIDCLDNFKNTTKLIYKKFINHVRIQTDKDFYEPGDDINFRVLFLDKYLRPARPERDALIWIADGKRNRVKEIKGFKSVKGVYTGKLKISESPVTGDWHLGVWNDGGVSRILHFKVDKIDVPKFFVKVEATKSVSVKDGEMQVIVRANYNYGKPLDGKVTLILFLDYHNFYDDIELPMLTTTGKIIKGKAKFDININEGIITYLPYESSPYYITIVATVEERLYGTKINGTASTTLYPYRFSINCVNGKAFSTFEADKAKDLLFQITYIDGSYLKDKKSTIELTNKEVLRKNNWWHREHTLDNNTLIPTMSNNRPVSFKAHMNETGFITFKVALPKLAQYEGYLHYYSLELIYLDEQHEVCDTHLYWDQIASRNSAKEEEQKTKEYFILEDNYLPGNRLHLNKASQYTLNSSQPLTYFDYNVIGRGNILKSGRIELLDKPKFYNLTLTPQFSWAPSVWVYVNYIDANGEYHYDERLYEVVLELENQINVTAAEKVKPGEEVALKIQTAPNSFVGLIATDQTAFLLRTDNDLNFYELSKLLGSYSTYTLQQADDFKHPSEMSGCVTLTNADYLYNSTRAKNMKRNLLLAANKSVSVHSTAGGATDATKLKAYKYVSHTWIFADIENTEASEFIWTTKIPETITSWVLTAFSLNPQKGLAVAINQTKITTFQHFFISVRLPYSVKRGEVINVPALLFNYFDKTLGVTVTLDNSNDEYEFIEFGNKVINKRKIFKNIRVPANEAVDVSFLLRPKVIGNVMLKFTAISPVSGNTIYKSMQVIPEGITFYANRAYFVNLQNESELKCSSELEFPQDIVSDSKHVEVEVMGDILSPVLNNLDNLVRLPTGCGEATMFTLVHNYLVIKYLKHSKRLTPTMETKLRHNLETGYQNILIYRLIDGSFSNFGSMKIGSTWLTAYVIRYMQQIKEFINVDTKIIEEGLVYLTSQQAANGTFTENSDCFCASQRNHLTLTAAAVLAILENSTIAQKYSEELSKGLDFIAQDVHEVDTLHAQAIGAFTLNRAKHTRAKEKISKVKASVRSTLFPILFSAEKQQFDIRWEYNVFSNGIEMTSYILLILLDEESTDIDDIVPIIKWLVAQRNSYGGFASTQDTVVGLTALIEFAEFANYQPAQMTVNLESKEKNKTFILAEGNGIFYQSIELPPQTRSLEFTANGTGSALLQIAYQYNVLENRPNPSFTIDTMKIHKKNLPLHLEILVCVSYVGKGESSNMAILEFYTPSGYVINDEDLKDIKEMKIVGNTELKNVDTLLVVYFEYLYKDDLTCFLVQAVRTHAVAMQKPAAIVLYDYYDTSKKATVFYEIESKLCDICETQEGCYKCK